MSGSGVFPVGAMAEVRLTVDPSDTAIALGSGDLPVVGTPRLVALCEEATVAAVAPHLDPSATSVGVQVELSHLAPSGIGAEIVAGAELTVVDGRRLGFRVWVTDEGVEVARGSVTRVVVDRRRFLERPA
ncbi:MAG: thioesterase [Acidimicrobiia bacterium]|jgi:fluoroacetyl-CoA thioesterase